MVCERIPTGNRASGSGISKRRMEMRAGTVVILPDGREGTVVYNGLDGEGIKWGRHEVTLEDLAGNGGCFGDPAPAGYAWHPDAMLRDPYDRASLPCVGREFEVVENLASDLV